MVIKKSVLATALLLGIVAGCSTGVFMTAYPDGRVVHYTALYHFMVFDDGTISADGTFKGDFWNKTNTAEVWCIGDKDYCRLNVATVSERGSLTVDSIKYAVVKRTKDDLWARQDMARDCIVQQIHIEIPAKRVTFQRVEACSDEGPDVRLTAVLGDGDYK